MTEELKFEGTTTLKYFSGETLIDTIVTHGSSILITSALYKVGRDAELKGFGRLTHIECWWQPAPFDGHVYNNNRQWRLEID